MKLKNKKAIGRGPMILIVVAFNFLLWFGAAAIFLYLGYIDSGLFTTNSFQIATKVLQWIPGNPGLIRAGILVFIAIACGYGFFNTMKQINN